MSNFLRNSEPKNEKVSPNMLTIFVLLYVTGYYNLPLL